nr:YceD family protein [Methylomarinum sp. Ch1-1]MDP4519948.1 YceD family protein [Methylomarinum sp. Ch1-1]
MSGTIKISEFARLSEFLADKQGDVQVEFSFAKEGRQAIIHGRIKATLALTCQTCLQEVLWPLEITVNLGVVSSLEQADRLAAEYEPLLLDAEKISLRELVEDEMLLALPDYPRHDYDCIAREQSQAKLPVEDDNEQIRSDNPFSVLAKLKNTGDK